MGLSEAKIARQARFAAAEFYHPSRHVMAAAAAPLSLPALEALINAPIRTEALTRLLTLPDPSLDALQAAMRAADGGLPLEDKRRLLVATYPRTVAGKDFNAWALQRGLVRSEADATALRGHLLEIGALVEVGRKDKPSNDEAAWYRLREDEETTVLNTRALYFGPTLPANLLSELLRKRILGMYGQFMNEQGTSVDYKGLAASPKFAEYERAASALQSADLETLGEAEKLAFWINLYNALVIHGYVVLVSRFAKARAARLLTPRRCAPPGAPKQCDLAPSLLHQDRLRRGRPRVHLGAFEP